MVHNGIIENFEELRAQLRAKGYVFPRPRPTYQKAISSPAARQTQDHPDLFDAVRATVASWSAPTPSAWWPESTPNA